MRYRIIGNQPFLRWRKGKWFLAIATWMTSRLPKCSLNHEMWSGKHTFLYQDGSSTNATHTFTGEDVIGIDMNYNGEYVRMSDIDVFGQSQG